MPLTAAIRGSEKKLTAEEAEFLRLKLISAISHTTSEEWSNAGAVYED